MQHEVDVKSRLMSAISMISKENAPLISSAIRGEVLVDKVKSLKVNLLGIKYTIELSNGNFKVNIEDPLNREEDSLRLLAYMTNAIERALKGKVAYSRRGLVSLLQLAGGQAARLYEKKIIDFLTAELDGSSIEDIEKVAKNIGGSVVEHLSATWSLEISPLNGIRVRIAFWQGEEDIPSGAAILIGEEVREMDIPIEELITLIEIMVNRLVLLYRKETGRQPKLFHSLYL
ncbi:MAG: DUF3786 domain-containing protein [Candidatus Nezhaarchaeota archaeon]|nr:DUF3786 domain-containing protein [Candidatus Nezhaarchaeota archaeon]MCX8141781.1 DUF3786 domain-containing protein [Candidatus Nezhaarchaeota archaeon]MDW8050440.1 DUF3786 domain-containing protein [Nitrososphaerota archaeon]